MDLNELDIDDDDIILDNDGVDPGDDEGDEKQWMEPDKDRFTALADDDEPENDNEQEDLITSVLKSKGIDPDAVKIANDKGEVEEVKFSDLSLEEQAEILNYSDTPSTSADELADDEINFLNEIRTSGVSIQDYVEYQKAQAIQEYLQGNQEAEEHFEIDDMSDDELFLADLKAKIEDLTEDEALQALSLEKQNESLFQKKVQGIRNDYKRIELSTKEAEQVQALKDAQEQAESFEREITSVIEQNNSIDLGESSLELSEDDMNEIASFILDQDATGTRYIAKALNDPKTLVEMAWYVLKGKEAFNQVSEYYKQKITEATKYNYNKGYEDAKSGKSANTAKAAVVRKPSTATRNQPEKKNISIYDID